MVMLAKNNPSTKQVKDRIVNSCLVMLCSIHGCAITTTEGLWKGRNNFHAIHKRLSAFHGSQCGFSTPGMAMAIKHHDQASDVLSKPSSETLQRALQGNICRCTGYRPLLDVCKSFASDVDLEAIGLNTCWNNKADAKEANFPQYDPKGDPAFPEFLIDELESATKVGNNHSHGIVSAEIARFTYRERSKEGEMERAWVSAGNVADLRAVVKALSGRDEQVKLVVGNTSAG